jgi:DNA-binding MarR family transcriptional regulator
MMKPGGDTERARAVGEAVLESVPAVMGALRAHMREGRAEGLSVPQFRALLYLRRNPASDLSGVAEFLGAGLPAASELISRLVRDGLVSREADPASRRRVQLTLSESGERQLAEARDRTLDWLVERLGDHPPDRLQRIETALTELRDALEADADR